MSTDGVFPGREIIEMSTTVTLNADEVISPEERIIAAGNALFFEFGFSAVSTAKLAEEAGVSKSTIYKYFGDMRGVLRAVVERKGATFFLEVHSIPDTENEYWIGLIDYGENLLTLLNQREVIRFDQMMHEEARRNPGLGMLFYDSAYGRTHEDITAYMSRGKSLGYVNKPAPAAQLADYLICMWEGLAMTRTRLDVQTKPFDNPRSQSIEAIETLFSVSIRDVLT